MSNPKKKPRKSTANKSYKSVVVYPVSVRRSYPIDNFDWGVENSSSIRFNHSDGSTIKSKPPVNRSKPPASVDCTSDRFAPYTGAGDYFVWTPPLCIRAASDQDDCNETAPLLQEEEVEPLIIDMEGRSVIWFGRKILGSTTLQLELLKKLLDARGEPVVIGPATLAPKDRSKNQRAIRTLPGGLFQLVDTETHHSTALFWPIPKPKD